MNLPLTYELLHRTSIGDCDYCTVETDLGPKPTRDVCEELTDGTKRCTECKKRNARICPGPCESGRTVYGNNNLCSECTKTETKMDGTKYCIAAGCSREATEWSGNVIKSRDRVLAGWCDEHTGCPCPNAFGKGGCYGIYDKTLGLKSVSSDQIKNYA